MGIGARHLRARVCGKKEKHKDKAGQNSLQGRTREWSNQNFRIFMRRCFISFTLFNSALKPIIC